MLRFGHRHELLVQSASLGVLAIIKQSKGTVLQIQLRGEVRGVGHRDFCFAAVGQQIVGRGYPPSFFSSRSELTNRGSPEWYDLVLSPHGYDGCTPGHIILCIVSLFDLFGPRLGASPCG